MEIVDHFMPDYGVVLSRTQSAFVHKDRCKLSEPFATERWNKTMAHYMLQVKYTLEEISQIAVSGDTRQETVRPYHRVVAARHMHWMFQSSV